MPSIHHLPIILETRTATSATSACLYMHACMHTNGQTEQLEQKPGSTPKAGSSFRELGLSHDDRPFRSMDGWMDGWIGGWHTHVDTMLDLL